MRLLSTSQIRALEFSAGQNGRRRLAKWSRRASSTRNIWHGCATSRGRSSWINYRLHRSRTGRKDHWRRYLFRKDIHDMPASSNGQRPPILFGGSSASHRTVDRGCGFRIVRGSPAIREKHDRPQTPPQPSPARGLRSAIAWAIDQGNSMAARNYIPDGRGSSPGGFCAHGRSKCRGADTQDAGGDK